MTRWTRRHRPSEAARHRLAAAIRRNRAELEVQVAEGLLRSELYLETGHPTEAAEVLEEQRRRVIDFEGRVQRALSSAVTEAEAEAVLSGAPGVEVLHDDRRLVGRAPQLIAAALVLVLSAALAGLHQLDDPAVGMPVAVRIDSTDRTDAPTTDATSTSRPDDLLHASDVPQDTTGAGTTRSHTAGSASTDWAVQQTSLLERLGVGLRERSDVLRELEGLVSTLVPGTSLPDQVWLQLLSDAVAATESQAERPDSDREAAGDARSDAEDEHWFGDDQRPADDSTTRAEHAAEEDPDDPPTDSSEPSSGEQGAADEPDEGSSTDDGADDGGLSPSDTFDPSGL